MTYLKNCQLSTWSFLWTVLREKRIHIVGWNVCLYQWNAIKNGKDNNLYCIILSRPNLTVANVGVCVTFSRQSFSKCLWAALEYLSFHFTLISQLYIPFHSYFPFLLITFMFPLSPLLFTFSLSSLIFSHIPDYQWVCCCFRVFFPLPSIFFFSVFQSTIPPLSLAFHLSLFSFNTVCCPLLEKSFPFLPKLKFPPPSIILKLVQNPSLILHCLILLWILSSSLLSSPLHIFLCLQLHSQTTDKDEDWYVGEQVGESLGEGEWWQGQRASGKLIGKSV